jgi:hypothetical protein
MTVIEQLALEGINLKPYPGDFGVEIEVEATGAELPPAPAGWRKDYDGSLRGNCAEYVLKTPLSKLDACRHIVSLHNSIKNWGVKVKDSFRAGVHIHVNVQEYEQEELITFASLYYLLEPLLMQWCGEDRAGNYFCLSGDEAEDVVMWASTNFRDKEGYLTFKKEDRAKYSGMNFCTIPKYGSLEFRGLGTKPSFSNIIVWITLLEKVKEKAKTSNMAEVFIEFSMTETKDFLSQVFGNFAKEFEKIPNKTGLLHKGMRTAQQFYYFSRKD